MSLKLHGLGKITGIDQGLSVVGVTTLHNELSVSGDVVVGGGLTVTGVLTYEDVTNVDSIGIITARSGIIGDLTGNVTGDITGNIIGSPTLSGISSSISDTAVDVFVYDTSKDSDGGAWRKRTQHTSWYNETLNTSTRGSRKEFPAVAVIVAESNPNKVTIYDGDDPDLPMWMVFNASTNTNANFLAVAGQPLSSIFMLNGELGIGFPSANGWGLNRVNFLSDSQAWYWISANIQKQVKNSIAERNLQHGYYNTASGISGLANARVNDIAMTVLPNARVDDATGLPVPTIAVATNAGIGVITDSGSVYDLTTSDVYDHYSKVEFGDNNRLYYTAYDTQVLYSRAVPSADQNYTAYNTQNTNRVMFPTMDHGGFTSGHPVRLLGTNGGTNPLLIVKNKASGSNETSYAPSGFGIRPGLTFIDEGETNPTSMVAYATTSYNTGYMVGDIKGAFLSDTDTTNATDSNVVNNGTFDSNTSGWFGDSGASISWDSGGFASVGNGGGDNTYAIAQSGILVSGAKYRVTGRVQPSMSGSYEFRVRAGGAGTQWNMTSGLTNAQWYSFDTGIITADGTTLEIGSQGGTITNFYLDDVYVWKLEEENRSANNTGLEVHGTVTKSAVATGAELVGYSGFSNTNVLIQQYSSNLDPGTGDYSFMIWFKCSPTSGEQILMRRFSSSSVTGGMMMRIISSSSVIQWYVRDTSSTATAVNSTGTALDDGTWHCVVGTREGSTARLYIDGKLNASSGCSGNSHNPGTDANLVIGAEELVGSPGTFQNPADLCSLALVRYSLSAPSAAQVKKMYEDEKFLFQENAACTLYGSSDAVTALAYDEVTDRLHVGTSSGRSDFQGLRRINNTTTAVTTAISAHDEFIAEQ